MRTRLNQPKRNPSRALPVEAWDVAQGPGWREGVNKVISGDILVKNVARLLESELLSNPVKLTPVTDMGRGLACVRGLRDGEKICDASSLFFDKDCISAASSFLCRTRLHDVDCDVFFDGGWGRVVVGGALK